MKALRFENGKLSIANMPRPAANGEALVRVTASGICNTDLEIIRGYAGFHGTIGHEFVGTVEESPDRPDLNGKRVVGEINAGCGVCVRCLAGDPRHCPARTVLGIVGRDGCHAEYLTLPSRNLFEIADGIADEEAVFTEPLAAAVGITEQVAINAETQVAVIGDGKLGLLCAMAMGLNSQSVTLFGRHSAKLRIAANAGIETVIASYTQPPERKFDVVIEASGSESGFDSAVELVKPRGRIVLKSTFHGTPAWPASRIVVDEITVVGSRCGRFEPAIRLLAERKIDVRQMISDQFSLEDGLSAIDKAAEKGILKVLLRM